MPNAMGADHVGAHENLGPFNPFQVFSQPSDEGIVVGEMENSQPFFVDFHQWVARGFTMGTSVKFIGRRGGGKTASMQVLASRFSTLKHAKSNERRRVTAEIIRRNAGVSEYDKHAKALGTESRDMSKYGSNMLDYRLGMSDLEQYALMRPMLERVGGVKLTTTERRALKCCFYLMYTKAREDSSIPVLSTFASTAGIDEYRRYCLHEIIESFRDLQISAKTKEMLAKRRHRKLNVNPKRVRAAFGSIFELLSLFVEEHGETFNGNHSLAELLSEEAVILDCTTLSEDTSALLEMLLWHIRSAAVARYDHTFMADYELHDESWKRYDNPTYGEEMVRHLKMIRGSGAVIMQAWHRPSDVEQVKKAGREYARTSFRETDVWFIFKLDQADAEEMRKYVPITPAHIHQIVNFMPGECLVIIGDKFPPFKVTFDLSPDELEMIESNTASLVMAAA